MVFQLLHRIDPDRNMARFYRVEVLPDLFGLVTVERAWGRISGRGQKLMVSFPSFCSAEREAARMVRAKAKRGYVNVAEDVFWDTETARARPGDGHPELDIGGRPATACRQ